MTGGVVGARLDEAADTTPPSSDASTRKSRIDVTGKGYLLGRTTGNTGVGGSTGRAGGSHGGLGYGGGGVYGSYTNAVYGDYADPDDWGSGGGGSGEGGGLVRIAAGTLTLDGALLANGNGGDYGGGSGGGILVSVATLEGAGRIQASGGINDGGGGRIAVYAEDYSGFDLGEIKALGRGKGQDGTVHVAQGGYHTHVRSHAPAGLNNANVLIRGPLGPITATAFSDAGDRALRIDFPLQTENGYSFTLIVDTVAPRATSHTPAGGTYYALVFGSHVTPAATFKSSRTGRSTYSVTRSRSRRVEPPTWRFGSLRRTSSIPVFQQDRSSGLSTPTPARWLCLVQRFRCEPAGMLS